MTLEQERNIAAILCILLIHISGQICSVLKIYQTTMKISFLKFENLIKNIVQ